jgi:Uma2 family endonuclease
MNPQIKDPTQAAALPALSAAQLPIATGEPYGLDPEDIPNLDDVVIEDGAPVESIFAEKQLRLLTEPLYTSWTGPGEGRPFLVLANVGLFYKYGAPPLAPDVMLSLDVSPAEDLSVKGNRSYFTWLRGKAPDVVIEIVSDKRGGEDTLKMLDYARIGIPCYVVFDPEHHLSPETLRGFTLDFRTYKPASLDWLPDVGLGLMLWEGVYEAQPGQWLRWCEQNRSPILTGRERAEQMRQQLERLEAQLRAHGIEPSA